MRLRYLVDDLHRVSRKATKKGLRALFPTRTEIRIFQRFGNQNTTNGLTFSPVFARVTVSVTTFETRVENRLRLPFSLAVTNEMAAFVCVCV